MTEQTPDAAGFAPFLEAEEGANKAKHVPFTIDVHKTSHAVCLSLAANREDEYGDETGETWMVCVTMTPETPERVKRLFDDLIEAVEDGNLP